MEYKTIKIVKELGVVDVILNRPEKHNAFNAEMIEEIRHVFTELDKDAEVRVVVLTGQGTSFCAGADLNWMREVSTFSYEENLKESENLSACFHAIYSCSKPTIANVQGASIGGANGLLAACDIAIAHENTVFSLSEVKIGVVPACISPYILKRIGESRCRELMITGKRFTGKEAAAFGLVNFSGSEFEIDNYLANTIESIQSSGPEAVGLCKKLLYDLSNHWTMEEAGKKTAELIAKIRQSDEAQEGMDAFLNKRKPNWID